MPSTPGDFYIILSRVVMHCYLDSRMVNAKQLQNFKSLGNTLGQFSWMMTRYVSIIQDSNLHCDIFKIVNEKNRSDFGECVHFRYVQST